MRRGLQAFVGVLGVVALTAGLVGVLFGAALVPGEASYSPSVDSEMRFFAAWYAVAGVVLLRAAPKIEHHRATLLAVSAALVLAASGRVLSMLTVGTPHTTYIVLTVVEYVVPIIVLPWQRRVARGPVRARA